MQVLTVDVGTGTQDIYLFDSDLDLENGYKLVVPSPTLTFHRQIRRATERGVPVVLTGDMMGGGPISWAASAHIAAGYPLYATPSAARTFNDDLDVVQREMGATLISEEDAGSLTADGVQLELKDFDFQLIRAAFAQFGYQLAPDVLAVAVFDHGEAPPGYSDRQFRFDYVRRRIEERNTLSAFAYQAGEVPAAMTRLRAIVRSARGVDLPLMVMDTAPAAVLGATLDSRVAARDQVLIANVGNLHCLVFRLGAGGIDGVFEHHTGEVSTARLDELIGALALATLAHDDVFHDHGHGALVFSPEPMRLPDGSWGVAVTGPRRNVLRNSRHRAYFAVPFGDMMMAGCFGMLRALCDVYPEHADQIMRSLSGAAGRPPWESR